MPFSTFILLQDTFNEEVKKGTPVNDLLNKDSDKYIWKLIGGSDNISLRNHTIREIVEGPFFKAIEDSWSCSSVKDGKLKVCANKCGIGFDAYSEQFK